MVQLTNVLRMENPMRLSYFLLATELPPIIKSLSLILDCLFDFILNLSSIIKYIYIYIYNLFKPSTSLYIYIYKAQICLQA